ncbi:MAG TPA: hypothetical protein DDY17_01330 [Syntrophaceae bacterium]|nr:hypothetical protein [Syntrophaceae bacterium]
MSKIKVFFIEPFMTMGGHKIDAMVVGGIGAAALMKLNADGIKVYKVIKETVKENLDLLKDERLPELTLKYTGLKKLLDKSIILIFNDNENH